MASEGYGEGDLLEEGTGGKEVDRVRKDENGNKIVRIKPNGNTVVSIDYARTAPKASREIHLGFESEHSADDPQYQLWNERAAVERERVGDGGPGESWSDAPEGDWEHTIPG